jgi:hypothetical protein
MIRLEVEGKDWTEIMLKLRSVMPQPAVADVVEDTPEPAGAKRGRKPGAKTKISESDVSPVSSEIPPTDSPRAVEPVTALAEAPSPLPADAVTSLPITFEEFKARMNAVLGANGDNLRHITAILNEHGYAKIKEVKPEDYAKILAKCDELVAG